MQEKRTGLDCQAHTSNKVETAASLQTEEKPFGWLVSPYFGVRLDCWYAA
jgi:hypothetical protein